MAADGCCSHPNSALSSLVEITESEIRLRGTSSRVVRVASDAGGNDGLRPTALIFDEVHEFTSPSRIRNHQVLGNGVVKRGGLELNISTVGADRETLLGKLDAYCRQVAAGEVDDEHLVYVCHSAEGLVADLDTDEGLRQAILAANPSATGPGAFVDVPAVMRRFREIPRPEGKRYHGWCCRRSRRRQASPRRWHFRFRMESDDFVSATAIGSSGSCVLSGRPRTWKEPRPPGERGTGLRSPAGGRSPTTGRVFTQIVLVQGSPALGRATVLRVPRRARRTGRL
jgi:hypothetical protein